VIDMLSLSCDAMGAAHKLAPALKNNSLNAQGTVADKGTHDLENRSVYDL